jgi:hypothetical protein
LFLVGWEALEVQDHQQVQAPPDPMTQEDHCILAQVIKYQYLMPKM